MHCTDYGTRRPPWAALGDRASYLCGKSHHAGNDAVLAVTVRGIPMGVGEAPADACATCVWLDKALSTVIGFTECWTILDELVAALVEAAPALPVAEQAWLQMILERPRKVAGR